MPLAPITNTINARTSGKSAKELRPKRVESLFLTPMARMGQRWQRPPDPAGWKEEDAQLITPQGLLARVDWAMQAPRRLFDELPDTREFVTFVAGRAAPEPLVSAASAADSRAEGIGLILASPRFQRR